MGIVGNVCDIDIKENYIYQLNKSILEILLKDHTSNKNIIWATDMYAWRGKGYQPQDPIAVKSITGVFGSVIKPRTKKSQKEQKQRIKTKAEVFTPSWVCKQMADSLDAIWNCRETKTSWQDYVKLRVLEITCGEAPFLASRYDTVSGEWLDVQNRIGLLDRKLQAVSENIDNEQDWVKWAFEAYKSTYGYEWQGDSILIARENLLFTFIDYYVDKFENYPIIEYLIEVSKIISWNIWQMDGLNCTPPNYSEPNPHIQLSFFDDEMIINEKDITTKNYCNIKNWLTKRTIKFCSNTGEYNMKFDFVIGNPPYQDNTIGDNKTFAPQIYNIFLDCAYTLSDKVEMIHPARFLFNAGSTPKQWNEKMLQDKHLKVLAYFAKSADVFPATDIKGGVAITYRDATKDFGAIEIYSAYPELNSIKQKVIDSGCASFGDIVFTRTAYRLTDTLHKEHPEAISQLSDGHPYDMSSNIFVRLPQVFFDVCPNDDDDYVQIYGLVDNKRGYKFIKRKYVKPFKNLDTYKVFVPQANGSGAIGEVLSTPLIGQPLIGHTETFISIGSFESEFEAIACLKYVKSKFARTLLGVLKVTQHNPPEKWKYIPMQDFTSSSDIDWRQSVAEIDVQLYRKYGLSDEEVAFIETHVKEMI